LGKFCQIYQELKIKKQSLTSFLKIEVKPMTIQVDIKEAPFYKWGKEEGEKEGEKKGLIKGLKEAILLGVQFKFGRSKVKEVKKLLEKKEDINLLKKIHKKMMMANTWEDFIKIFRGYK
jgi:predicted transposase YdaD